MARNEPPLARPTRGIVEVTSLARLATPVQDKNPRWKSEASALRHSPIAVERRNRTGCNERVLTIAARALRFFCSVWGFGGALLVN